MYILCVVVAHACNLRTLESEAEGMMSLSLVVLHGEYQDTQGHRTKLCLKISKTTITATEILKLYIDYANIT